MPRRRVGRRRDQRSWLDNVVLRARLSQPARNAYPDFAYRRHQRSNGGVNYSFSATVPVEGYEPRHVTVLFDPPLPDDSYRASRRTQRLPTPLPERQ